jgi:hypothetical protein
MSQDSDLSAEFRRIRRGRGLDRSDLSDVIGPELRRLCNVDPAMSKSETRTAVRDFVGELIRRLPAHEDLRQVAETVYGLNRERFFPKLEDRVAALATHLNTSQRSVRRRMDTATEEMMRLAEDGEPAPPRSDPGWQVTRLETLFRLDTPTPELYELRTIRTTREISEVPVRFTLPETAARHDLLTVDALFGARVVEVGHTPGNGSCRALLQLPRPLPAGETHEIWLRVVLPDDRPTWPHYAVVPLDPYDACTVRVRFAPDRRPSEVWLLDGVPYTDLCDDRPSGKPIQPSALGEVSHRFGRLRTGYGYGFAWTPVP